MQESLGAIRDLKFDHTEAAQLADFEVVDRRYATTSASTVFIASAPRYLVEAGTVLIIAGLAALLAARGECGALLLVGGIALGSMGVFPLMQQAYRSWAMMSG